VVICPVGEKEIFSPSWLAKTTVLSNYMYAARLGFFNDTWGYPKYWDYGARTIEKCQEPAYAAILIDGFCVSNGNNRVFFDFYDAVSATWYADARHRGRINTLYADGHAGTDDVYNREGGYIDRVYMWSTNPGQPGNMELWPRSQN
jgi:prepilin-type processing-associated H-X9-DG protein